MSADMIQMLYEVKQMNLLMITIKIIITKNTNTGKQKRTLTEKGEQYRVSILDKKKKALILRINRKMNDIDVLLYTYENDVTLKEQL